MGTGEGVVVESVGYHRDSETYRAQYDPYTTSTSVAVVVTLAEALDAEPLELDPLYDTVDTDALDTLVGVQGTKNGVVRMSFVVAGHRITVSNDGRVAVSPSSSGGERTNVETDTHR